MAYFFKYFFLFLNKINKIHVVVFPVVIAVDWIDADDDVDDCYYYYYDDDDESSLTSDYLKEFAAIKADDDVVAADETLLNYVQDYLLLNFVLDSEDFKNKIYFKFNFKNLKIKRSN